MSDYFGALVRASGISLGIRAEAVTDERDMGLDVARSIEDAAMPTEVAPMPASEQRVPAAVAPMPKSSEASGPDDAGRTAAVPIMAGEREPQQPERSPIAATVFPDTAEHAVAPDAASLASPARAAVSVQSSIQAALQWVANGNEAASRTAEPVSYPGSIAPVPEPAPNAARAVPQVADRLEPRSSALDAQSAITIDVPSRTHRAASTPAFPGEAIERAPSSRGGEAIEVSIGAIHVRVDAPPVNTQARPAVPVAPPTSQPSAPTRAPQSSRLARRALRRI